MRGVFRTLLLASLAAACTGTPAPERAVDARTDGDARSTDATPTAEATTSEPSFAPTFSALYTEVIARHNCLLGLCHGEGASGGGLSLFPRSRARENLLARSTGFECRASGLAGVDPGRPDSSLLWLKLQPAAPCGRRMPPDGALDPRHSEQVRAWIAAGARED